MSEENTNPAINLDDYSIDIEAEAKITFQLAPEDFSVAMDAIIRGQPVPFTGGGSTREGYITEVNSDDRMCHVRFTGPAEKK